MIAPSMRGLRPAALGPDVLAGLTLLAIAVPEQMATARLAGMPAAAGLYAFVVGSALFALLGPDRWTSVGADSTIAPIIAAAVAGVAVTGSARYLHLVSLLALMVGAVLAAVGLLRLGWISELMSTPVVTGVLAGIGVEILVREIPAVLGLPGGGSSTLDRLRLIVDQLHDVHGIDGAIAAGVLGCIVLAERVDRRIPGALAGLVVSTGAVAAFHLVAHGVAVVGALHGGLPAVAFPSGSWTDARHLLVPALTIAFVCVAQTTATVRSGGVAPSSGELDRDLLALGASSLGAGMLGSFAVDSSPPRTEVVRASGGRTQLSGVVAAALVLLVALFATGLLHDLPDATLGAILLFVATRLLRLRELRAIWRFDLLELFLAVVTLVVVALVGIEQGVLVAVLLSLAERTWRAARPRDAVLGREPGTTHWIPPDVGRPTEQVSGVLVYLLYAPLWFGNAEHVAQRIRGLVRSQAEPVRALVLDADGVPEIDYTGARRLGELARELRGAGVTTAIARSSHLVHHDLKHSGLIADIGPELLFASVEEAVEALAKGPAPGGRGVSGGMA